MLSLSLLVLYANRTMNSKQRLLLLRTRQLGANLNRRLPGTPLPLSQRCALRLCSHFFAVLDALQPDILVSAMYNITSTQPIRSSDDARGSKLCWRLRSSDPVERERGAIRFAARPLLHLLQLIHLAQGLASFVRDCASAAQHRARDLILLADHHIAHHRLDCHDAGRRQDTHWHQFGVGGVLSALSTRLAFDTCTVVPLIMTQSSVCP